MRIKVTPSPETPPFALLRPVENSKASLETEMIHAHCRKHETEGKIGYFFVDNVLPDELARKCFDVFPDKSEMRQVNNIDPYIRSISQNCSSSLRINHHA